MPQGQCRDSVDTEQMYVCVLKSKRHSDHYYRNQGHRIGLPHFVDTTNRYIT